ncbi:MAG: tol-pal system protein YbgF [Caldimicrobium sp.]|nr:tol-pal system protein YbgF [Caldimicrobium sp.]
MKRYLILIFLSSLLSACVEDTSTLKVRLINLESRLNILENRVAKLENDTQALESRITKAIVERQSLIVSDLEEVKKEQLRLQAQLEDLSYKLEGKEREEKGRKEDLLTRVSALELRLKRIESLVQPSNETAIQNATTQNATSNQTVVQQPEVQKEKQTNGLHTEKPTPKPQEKAKQQEVPKNLKEEDLFQQAYLYFQKGDYRLARSYWEEYLKRYPKGRWVGQTYYWLGETYFKEKNYEEAIIYYQKLIDLPEPNPFKPKAMLKQAEAFLQLKDKKAAEVVLKKLVKTFPGTQEAKEGEKILKGLK